MKRIFFTAIFVCFFACGKAPALPPAGKVSQPPSAGAPETVVFVTKSGARYHLEGCSALRSSRIAATLAEAVSSGYEPCSRCNPPVLSSAQNPSLNGDAGTAAGIYRVNKETPAACESLDFSRLLKAEVIDHIDGDTVRIRVTNPPKEVGIVETIRLIGVDTPETVHPRREMEAFGKEASDFTKERLLGKTVYLAFDWDLHDRYGRLLAYIYTADKKCHNAELIRQGYGHAYTRFPFQFMEEFRGYEREAREGKKGLFGEK